MRRLRSSWFLALFGLVCVETSQAQTSAVLARRDWVDGATNAAQILTQHAWVHPGTGQIALGASPASLVWAYHSDGTWIAESLAVAANGTRLFAKHGSVNAHALLLSGHDANPPTPVWQDTAVSYNVQRDVVAPEKAQYVLTLEQQSTHMGAGVSYVVLNKYGLEAPVAEWTYASPIALYGTQSLSAVRVSEDGGRIALAIYDASASATKLIVLQPDSETPVLEADIPTFGNFRVFALSADGSVAVFGSDARLSFVDVATGSVLYQTNLFGSPQFGALTIDGTGQRIAFGTLNHVRIYERLTGGGYSLTQQHPLEPGSFARRAALSADGSTLVLGVSRQGNTQAMRVMALDLVAQSVLLDVELEGQGSLQNVVSSISVTPNGHRFAIGSWGDEGAIVPQVLVYRRDGPLPVLSEYLPGSVLDLELSPDGYHLAVAAKGVHANVMGGGGAFYLFEVGRIDVDVLGVPRVGSTVHLRQRLRPGAVGRVLTSSSLADSPAPAPELGEGLFYLDPASYLALPEGQAPDGGGLLTPYVIPDDPSLVGTTIYLQGQQVDEPRLSRNWIPLTILP